MTRRYPDEVEMRRMPEPLGPLFDSVRAPIMAPKATPEQTRRDALPSHGAADLNRARILAAFREYGPMTADAAGERCGLIPLAARPRVAELVRGVWGGIQHAPLLEPTGRRGASALGNAAVVWRVIG